MGKYRPIVLLILALGLLLLPGCWGSKETDEMAYVLALGFDKGEKEKLAITVSIANPKVIAGVGGGEGGGGGNGGEGGNGTLTYTVESYAPISAIDLLNTVIDRRVSFLHNNVFIFSEELAREGLARWLNPLNRYRELRGTARVFVCRGKARDFIEKNKSSLEISPTKQIELISGLHEATGLIQSVKFHEFYDAIKSDYIQPCVPLIALHEDGLASAKPGIGTGGEASLGKYAAGEVPVAGPSPAQFIGTAVFNEDKMVGLLNGQETRYWLSLRGLFHQGMTGIPDPLNPDLSVGLLLHQSDKPRYKTVLDQQGNVTIDVDIFIEPEIISIASGNNYEDPSMQGMLEAAFNESSERGMSELIRRTQEEFGADIFGFGNQVKRKFLTLNPWLEFQWLDRYPEATINVTVHGKIRRTGLQLETTKPVGVK
ncbi:MAG: Ger(x)C family spore germination protein [Pelotomaculum sp.]